MAKIKWAVKQMCFTTRTQFWLDKLKSVITPPKKRRAFCRHFRIKKVISLYSSGKSVMTEL